MVPSLFFTTVVNGVCSKQKKTINLGDVAVPHFINNWHFVLHEQLMVSSCVILSFLCDLTVCVVDGLVSVSTSFHNNYGTPRGSVLSPTLCVILIIHVSDSTSDHFHS